MPQTETKAGRDRSVPKVSELTALESCCFKELTVFAGTIAGHSQLLDQLFQQQSCQKRREATGDRQIIQAGVDHLARLRFSLDLSLHVAIHWQPRLINSVTALLDQRDNSVSAFDRLVAQVALRGIWPGCEVISEPANLGSEQDDRPVLLSRMFFKRYIDGKSIDRTSELLIADLGNSPRDSKMIRYLKEILSCPTKIYAQKILRRITASGTSPGYRLLTAVMFNRAVRAYANGHKLKYPVLTDESIRALHTAFVEPSAT